MKTSKRLNRTELRMKVMGQMGALCETLESKQFAAFIVVVDTCNDYLECFNTENFPETLANDMAEMTRALREDNEDEG